MIVKEKTIADKVRKDFPILDQEVNGKKLIYFDSAASSQNHYLYLILSITTINMTMPMYTGEPIA